MEYAPSISQIATLLADPKRSAMIWALIDGTARAAEELAILAGVTPSSASAHLARMSAGGLLKREARGRQRFFRLAAREVGVAVEALASVTAIHSERVREQNRSSLVKGSAPLRKVRECSDHLGGEVAADLLERLLAQEWLSHVGQRLEITTKGNAGMAQLGIYTQALASHQVSGACVCCGMGHQRPHLGGALGASLMTLFMQMGWVRLNEDTRVLQLTAPGARAIANLGAS